VRLNKCFVRKALCLLLASGCSFLLGSQKKRTKEKLPAAPWPINVGTLALPVLPGHADAGIVRLFEGLSGPGLIIIVIIFASRHCERSAAISELFRPIYMCRDCVVPRDDALF
jgi:hypothetical protein